MKKLIVITLVIAACAALCAPVWPRSETGEVSTAKIEKQTSTICAETSEEPEKTVEPNQTAETMAVLMTEKEEMDSAAELNSTPPIFQRNEEKPEIIAVEVDASTPTPPVPAASTTTADPYHTDIYPNNVYSEELIYNADGELIGKTITIPTAFGPDTIWINGRAYYDIPGFGLIEWSDPNQCTEDYTMYESGVKVGIMGGEDEAPARTAMRSQYQDWPEPTGEVIDQTISDAPTCSSTPPDYKPDTTPPNDPNARIVG